MNYKLKNDGSIGIGFMTGAFSSLSVLILLNVISEQIKSFIFSLGFEFFIGVPITCGICFAACYGIEKRSEQI